MANAQKPRLILNNAVNDIGDFKAFVAAAKPLSANFDLRIAISHLHRKNEAELKDPSDPYLEYSVNFPSLVNFIIPQPLKPFLNAAYVKANVALMKKKMAVIKAAGLKGAFLGREPVYFREDVYKKFPLWRGPRIDHPRRSRDPLFAMCFHQPDVQALYTDIVKELVREFPVLDTFYFWANDSGSGFCHYPGSYFGPNGPEHCLETGAGPAIANFQSAVLDGARAGGIASPLSMMTNVEHGWNPKLTPEGAFQHPSKDKSYSSVSIGADLTHTYPVRFLSDPLRLMEKAAAMKKANPLLTILWFSDVYHKAHTDLDTCVRSFKIFERVWKKPAAAATLRGRLELLTDLMAEEAGAAAAPEAVEGFGIVHDAIKLLTDNPGRMRSHYYPTYGSISHRWITRPFVAFPNELKPEEENYFLRHVFCVFGDEARRDLLDNHGKLTLHPAGDYNQYSTMWNILIREFSRASARFAAAAGLAREKAKVRFSTYAKAAKLLAIFYKNCRNTMEFAVLQANGVELPLAERAKPVDKAGWPIGWLGAYQKTVYTTMRNELDVIDEFLKEWADDKEGILTIGKSARDEDTFVLSPDLKSQMLKKRDIMLAKWQDVTRLAPIQSREFKFTYW